MSKLREMLVQRLEEVPNVRVDFWKDSDLLCIYFNDKEIAHFQNNAENNNEIDIRLTPAIIKKEGLAPPSDTTSHLDRTKNSRWLVQSFQNEADVDEMVRLVELATTLV